MSEPFLGEIRAFAFNYAPREWAMCTGQLLAISQNQPLFALLADNYGGDARTSFGLPDLQGRSPVGVGSSLGRNYLWGKQGGSPMPIGMGTTSFQLDIPHMPSHDHTGTVNIDLSGVTAATTLNVDAGADGTLTQPENDCLMARSPADNLNAAKLYLPKGTNQTTPVRVGGFTTGLSGGGASTITTSNTGGGQPVTASVDLSSVYTESPYLPISFCIALTGLFPARN